jgi:WD40 repeat protein
MEAAIRWSPHSTPQKPEFLIIDVAAQKLKLCTLKSLKSNPLKVEEVYETPKLPNYTAFDWSKTDPNVVAIGAASGEANVVQLDPAHKSGNGSEYLWSFPIKNQRRCNSIAFSTKNYLATGLERVRNDYCMNVYDFNSSLAAGQTEPYKKLAGSEAITSIKFFGGQPDTLIAGVLRQCIRLYDLRDPSSNGVAQFPTRQVHNLAIDPMDENSFISAGPAGDPVVSVWDRRYAPRSGATASADGGPAGPILEIRPTVDNGNNSTIWSLRFSGVKRGTFGVLSSSGEVKIIELAQHAVKPGLGQVPQNSKGGTPWSSRTYTRRTHNLAYPIYDQTHPVDQKARVMAVDFISPGNYSQGQAMLALHPSRDISLLKINDIARKVNITALDEICLWKNRRQCFLPQYDFDTSAEELIALQDKAKADEGSRRASDQAISSASRLEKLSLENFGHKTPTSYESPYYISSGDRHEDLLSLNFPSHTPELGDALKLLRTQRRRCQEGYLLDPLRNMQIVANDPWLVDMWDTVRRFEEFAKHDGMCEGGLDLSFLGVYSIWNMDFGNHRNRVLDGDAFTPDEFTAVVKRIVQRKEYPPFVGHRTKCPDLRQLCLALCGWTFSKDRLRQRCRTLMEKGHAYKAIVVAVMRGFKDLAQELLRSAIQQKLIHNIGLGAVIACESVNDDQRELCAWMAEETDDPYLKALLAYFISGDWKVVADMPLLPLSDRVGVAVKYLDDDRLGNFIKMQTAGATVSGNTEGLVLTGLTDRALDLFHHYMAKFNDLQTAVLVLSFTCPVYLSDHSRFDLWKDTYLMQLQSWRAFHQRSQYLDALSRRSRARVNGFRFADTPARPVSLRCNHCLSVLATSVLQKAPSPPPPSTNGTTTTTSVTPIPATTAPPGSIYPLPTRPPPTPASNSGLVCPHCGRRMPHCGICALLLGAPDPRRLGGAAADVVAAEDVLARQPLYCMACQHVFHGHHARDWFARHRMCPVPECGCMCGVLN